MFTVKSNLNLYDSQQTVAGLKHIIAPYLNEKDLEEIPAKVKKDLKITFVKEVQDVIKLAIGI